MSARIRLFRGMARWATVAALAIVILVVCAYPQGRPPAAAQNQPRSTMRDVSEALAQSVSNGPLRDVATCHFQAAFWGGYDVKVRVGSGFTSDGKPRIFELTQGRFFQRIDPKEQVRYAFGEDRSGTVSLPTSQEAFRRGVPFFIADVEFESADVLRFTVLSNPEVRIERAAGQVWAEHGEDLDMVSIDMPQAFSSSPEPRVMRISLDGPHEGKLYIIRRESAMRKRRLAQGEEGPVLLSVVVMISGMHDYSAQYDPFAYGLPCLVSNEIELKGLAKPKKPVHLTKF